MHAIARVKGDVEGRGEGACVSLPRTFQPEMQPLHNAWVCTPPRLGKTRITGPITPLGSTPSGTMVLQNKYKARASRRYQAQRGGGRGAQAGKVRGGRSAGSLQQPAQQDAASDGEHTSGGETDDDEDSEDSIGRVAVGGTLKEDSGSVAHGASSSKVGEGEAKQRRGAQGSERSKYAKRKLESNAWRFERSDGEEGAEGKRKSLTVSAFPVTPMQVSLYSPLTNALMPLQMHHQSQRSISRLCFKKLESHTMKGKKAQGRRAQVMTMI